MLTNGMFLVDRYEILDKIGAGGMSDVYKAKDHILGRVVAIKELKSEFSEDVNFVTKFRTEAQSAAGLEHPNIVNIYDVGSENGCHFIVMEHVEGITLKTYIEKKGQLSFKEAASIAIQVARGIEAAHNKQITHRDIKPHNIMISTEGKVKVMDFGIARASSSNTISSEVMGSVHYASPEQARNGFVDGRSDIYSLGIVMYEMVTGRVPFDGETTVAVALQHLQEEMVGPRTYAPDLPVSYEKIVLKCTQKNAERRYQNIGELLADLRQALVTPDEDFVVITPASIAAKTRIISNEELDEINNGANEADLKSETKFAESDTEEEDEDEDGTGFLDPKVEKIMTGVGIAVCLVIIGIIVYLGASIISSFKFGQGSDSQSGNTQIESSAAGDSESESEPESETENLVEMIEILDMPLEEAESALEEMGLKIFVAATKESDKEDNTILEQSVEAGESVERGTTVVVVVAGESSGEEDELKEVPNVVNLTENDAVNKIYNSGFTPDKRYENSDTVIKGHVISQTPEGGTEKENGETVTIVISQGRELVKVPNNLVGKYADEVSGKLAELGFDVVEGEKQYSSQYEEGVVFKVDNAGKQIEKGSKVTIYISLGAEKPKTYSYDKTYKCSVAEGEISYEYTLTDANGTKLKSGSGDGKSVRINKEGISTATGKLEIIWKIKTTTMVPTETQGTEDADGDGIMDTITTEREEIVTKTETVSDTVTFDPES
uniref:Stk1 family PASTA domain-containing Ser/Thr kinase n=1 Tax=Agathobacter sp. TaxID=2021311 RepID=UPI0040571829